MYKIKPINASEIAKNVNGKLYGKDLVIENVSIDTRENFHEKTPMR